jgi:diguanylate cyclase (GGDEF)-like protein
MAHETVTAITELPKAPSAGERAPISPPGRESVRSRRAEAVPRHARRALALAVLALLPLVLVTIAMLAVGGLALAPWAPLAGIALLVAALPLAALWRAARRVDDLADRLAAPVPSGPARPDPLGRIDMAVAALERRVRAMQTYGDPARRDDPMTGLPNRQTAMRRARDEITRARRRNEPLAVALVSIDIGAPEDDPLGRGRQDRALRLTAEMLMQGLRAYDVVGRWSHDLFVVLLPEAEIEHAVSAIERVRAMALEGGGLRKGEPLPPLHGGVAVLQPDDVTLTEIAERAARALARARSGAGAAVQSAPGPRTRPVRLTPV